MFDCRFIFVAAFILDVLVGDPVYRFHPIRLIGAAIETAEVLLRKFGLSGRIGGILLLFGMICLVLSVYLALGGLLSALHPWLNGLLNVYLVYSCIALRDLLRHATRVSKPLEKKDLPSARRAVQNIIGRDAQQLGSSGVARAVVESLAENFVDGLLSPFFWFLFGGIIAGLDGLNPCLGSVGGLLTFKVVSTLDSMVGYRNKKYLLFGRASAKMDDFMNFVPARLAIGIISVAAAVCGFSPKRAWAVGRRDRLKHSSPNAGHAESAVAGALGIRLGGPGIYPHGLVSKPWLGEGTADVTVAHISACQRLIGCASLLAFGLTLFGMSIYL